MTEQNRLRYLRMNQDVLHADVYQRLADKASNIGMHMVVFNPTESATRVLTCANQQKTTLTAFFETCATIEAAHQYTHQELYFVDPSAGEHFYLRLLLTVVHGPRLFDHLRMINGILCPTFKDAYMALDLLEDDNEWIYCLEEAAVMRSGTQLRSLFTIILTHSTLTQPYNLWICFRANMCDDLHPFLYNKYGILDLTEDQIYDFGLFLLDEILYDSNKSLNMFPSMPFWEHDWGHYRGNILIYEQLNCNYDILQEIVNECVIQLNHEQHIAYQDILNSVNEQSESEEIKQFTQWLLEIVDRTNISKNNMITIPKNMIVSSDLKSFINKTYSNICINNICTDQYLRDRIILSFRNDDVKHINLAVLDLFSGNERMYLSSDNATTD
ncbi:1196_t:CDS:2, partial [Cetraspora pellucida]